MPTDTSNILCDFWRKRNEIFDGDVGKRILQRYENNNNVIDNLLKIKIDYGARKAWTEENGQKINEINLPENVDDYFAASDNIATGGAFKSIENEMREFPGYADLINKKGSLLGGYEYGMHILKPEYRLVSNVITRFGESSNLVSTQRQPSAHFASNNYFFNVAWELARFRDNTFDCDNSRIVLHYPDPKYFGATLEEKEENERMALIYRFPYKFFQMWTHRNELVHLIGLESYINLIQYNHRDLAYADDPNLDQDFDSFTKKWTEYSERLRDMIPANERGTNFFPELSRMLSIIMLSDVDRKNAGALLRASKAIILYGPPGTGKTHTAKALAASLIGCQLVKPKDANKGIQPTEDIQGAQTAGENKLTTQDSKTESQTIPHEQDEKEPKPLSFEEECESTNLLCLDDYKFAPDDDQSRKKGPAWCLVQFHPGYTYEDFMGGISPVLSEPGQQDTHSPESNKSEQQSGQLSYVLKEGIFNKFCKLAEKNPEEKFILIIDEINRAELSAVFGELLYSLEYRDQEIVVPNFGKFKIPGNIYIIGTMNDVDKSLVTFDLALRRRFGFYKLAPNMKAIGDIIRENNNIYNNQGTSLDEKNIDDFVSRCRILNDSLKEKLDLGENYKIGQAYFTKIMHFVEETDNNLIISPVSRAQLWDYHLEPLIEEYLGSRYEEARQDTLPEMKKSFVEDKEQL